MRETLRYAVVFEKSANGYSCYVPDLPGCVAVATTLEEVEQLNREGMAIYIGELRRNGEPIPEPSTQIGFVEIDPALIEALKD